MDHSTCWARVEEHGSHTSLLTTMAFAICLGIWLRPAHHRISILLLVFPAIAQRQNPAARFNETTRFKTTRTVRREVLPNSGSSAPQVVNSVRRGRNGPNLPIYEGAADE